MSDELPEEYVPSELRVPKLKRRAFVDYAVGFRDGDNYGMTHGPNPSITNMLEVVPEEDPKGRVAVIVRLNKDGTDEIIYRWANGRWKRWRPR